MIEYCKITIIKYNGTIILFVKGCANLSYYNQVYALNSVINSLSYQMIQKKADLVRLKVIHQKLEIKLADFYDMERSLFNSNIMNRRWRGRNFMNFTDYQLIEMKKGYHRIPNNQLEHILDQLQRKISEVRLSIGDIENTLQSKRYQINRLKDQIRKESYTSNG